MSATALKTSAKIMNKGREPRQTLLIQALVDIHQRKSLKLNMKEPLELEPLRTKVTVRTVPTLFLTAFAYFGYFET